MFSDKAYWNNLAKDYITRKLNYKENNRIAKNVILFLGDGMGGTTITASRILRGQLNNHSGEETILQFEEFPHVALSKVGNTHFTNWPHLNHPISEWPAVLISAIYRGLSARLA